MQVELKITMDDDVKALFETLSTGMGILCAEAKKKPIEIKGEEPKNWTTNEEKVVEAEDVAPVQPVATDPNKKYTLVEARKLISGFIGKAPGNRQKLVSALGSLGVNSLPEVQEADIGALLNALGVA